MLRWVLSVAIIVSLAAARPAWCAGEAEPEASPPAADQPRLRRVALVIGNAAYPRGPLANSRNDAKAFAEALSQQLRFDAVLLHVDLTRAQMVRALQEFESLVEDADVALVLYAGHGGELAGIGNYLIPVDASLAREADLADEAVSLTSVQSRIKRARVLSLVILDASRRNEFPLADNIRCCRQGLGLPRVQGSMLVLSAAAEGRIAEDGVKAGTSAYMAAWLAHMARSELEVVKLIHEVHAAVREQTEGRQSPAIYGDLGHGQIFLHPATEAGR